MNQLWPTSNLAEFLILLYRRSSHANSSPKFDTFLEKLNNLLTNINHENPHVLYKWLYSHSQLLVAWMGHLLRVGDSKVEPVFLKQLNWLLNPQIGTRTYAHARARVHTWTDSRKTTTIKLPFNLTNSARSLFPTPISWDLSIASSLILSIASFNFSL